MIGHYPNAIFDDERLAEMYEDWLTRTAREFLDETWSWDDLDPADDTLQLRRDLEKTIEAVRWLRREGYGHDVTV